MYLLIFVSQLISDEYWNTHILLSRDCIFMTAQLPSLAPDVVRFNKSGISLPDQIFVLFSWSLYYPNFFSLFCSSVKHFFCFVVASSMIFQTHLVTMKLIYKRCYSYCYLLINMQNWSSRKSHISLKFDYRNNHQI